MIPNLSELVCDFANGLKQVDQMRPIGRSLTRQYSPGVGPLPEAKAVKAVTTILAAAKPDVYLSAGPCRYPESRQMCDCRIPGSWAIEFKLIRPYGDNGKEAEHWSENLLHPYRGNVSAIADCLKLRESTFKERKGIIVFGYEHTPPQINLETAVRSFEVIAREVVGLKLCDRKVAVIAGLVHPYHQQAKVFGWEIIS